MFSIAYALDAVCPALRFFGVLACYLMDSVVSIL